MLTIVKRSQGSAESGYPIVGAGHPRKTSYSVDLDRPFAVIARANAGVFEEAVKNLNRGRPYHFVGNGPGGYKMEKILDAYYLSEVQIARKAT